ncbi:MAG TPA: winged helix DNA-binding domain-containing protein [Candidatus Limnocylindria bacterium]|nr:winged helix DNA-binding domain-containing protein [Candidatus Limnocylindria bacterium]
MTAETLTQGRLNRALLARQLLLERSSISLPAALEQLAGIQNQYAPNAYIRLWSCVAGFRRADLTEAYESGAVVQGTLMRGTIHAVSAADYHRLLAGIRRPLQRWAERVYRGDASGRQEVVARLRHALAGSSVRRAELQALLDGVEATIRGTIDTDAELLRVPPSGTWARRRAGIYALADDVLGGHEEVSDEVGLAHLVGRYLAGFGPASLDDIAGFTGVPKTALKPVLAGLSPRLFRDESGRELLDVPDAPLPAEETPAPVRFLPTWDATLLVHARRTGILPEQYRPLIFNSKIPPSLPTFLVDGRVAGTWRWESGEIRLAPFGEVSPQARAELEEEAHRLAAFHADAGPDTRADGRGTGRVVRSSTA